MSDRPEITQKQIQSRAANQSFSRGKSLYNNGSISLTVRRGNKIEARISLNMDANRITLLDHVEANDSQQEEILF